MGYTRTDSRVCGVNWLHWDSILISRTCCSFNGGCGTSGGREGRGGGGGVGEGDVRVSMEACLLLMDFWF